MPEFGGNFVAALNEIALFEGADLAVMFIHSVLAVMYIVCVGCHGN